MGTRMFEMINLSMKETVKDRKESMALEVHKSVVNPRDTRSSFTVLMMSVISFMTSSALLSTILESEVGCFTFTFFVRTLISL